jgi:hypothetical protein
MDFHPGECPTVIHSMPSTRKRLEVLTPVMGTWYSKTPPKTKLTFVDARLIDATRTCFSSPFKLKHIHATQFEASSSPHQVDFLDNDYHFPPPYH